MTILPSYLLEIAMPGNYQVKGVFKLLCIIVRGRLCNKIRAKILFNGIQPP